MTDPKTATRNRLTNMQIVELYTWLPAHAGSLAGKAQGDAAAEVSKILGFQVGPKHLVTAAENLGIEITWSKRSPGIGDKALAKRLEVIEEQIRLLTISVRLLQKAASDIRNGGRGKDAIQ